MPAFGVDADDVAVADFRDRAAVRGLGRDVDRGRDLAGGAGHAAIGQERDLEAAVLQDAELRGELVQFGHADRLGALEADDGDDVAIEFAGLERGLQALLGMEDAGLGLDDAVLGLDGRDLDDRGAEIAAQQLQATVLGEGGAGRGEHLGIAGFLGRGLEAELVLDQLGLDGIVGEAMAPQTVLTSSCR